MRVKHASHEDFQYIILWLGSAFNIDWEQVFPVRRFDHVSVPETECHCLGQEKNYQAFSHGLNTLRKSLTFSGGFN